MRTQFTDKPVTNIVTTKAAHIRTRVPSATDPGGPMVERGIGNMSVVLFDRITPATTEAIRNMKARMEQAHVLATLDSKMFLHESWADMQKEKPITNPYSLLAKRFYGRGDFRALVLTGKLEKSIMTMDFHFVKENEGTYTFIQDMKMPWYMFVHEFGAKPRVTNKMRAWAINALGWAIPKRKQIIEIPKRQFFVRAMKRAVENYARRMQAAIRLAAVESERVELYSPYVSSSDVPIDMLKYDLNYGNVGAALFFVPPQLSPALAAWGGYGDLSSFVQGQFTTNLAIMYSRAMILGRTGITKKMIRRRIRGDVIFRRNE